MSLATLPFLASLSTSAYNTCASLRTQHRHHLPLEASLACPHIQAKLDASLLGIGEEEVETASLDNSHEREEKNEALTRVT